MYRVSLAYRNDVNWHNHCRVCPQLWSPAPLSRTHQTSTVPLLQVHHMTHVAQRKQLLEALFEKWDSSACGSLELEEVVAVLSTFEGGLGKEALMNGKEKSLLCENSPGGLQPFSDRANEVVARTSLILQAVTSVHGMRCKMKRNSYPDLSVNALLHPFFLCKIPRQRSSPMF